MNAKGAGGLAVIWLSNFLLVSLTINGVNGINITSTPTQNSATSADANLNILSSQTTQDGKLLTISETLMTASQVEKYQQDSVGGNTSSPSWILTSGTLSATFPSVITVLSSVETSKNFSTQAFPFLDVNKTVTLPVSTLGISPVSIERSTNSHRQLTQTSLASVTEALPSAFNRTAPTSVVISTKYSHQFSQSSVSNTTNYSPLPTPKSGSAVSKVLPSNRTSLETSIIYSSSAASNKIDFSLKATSNLDTSLFRPSRTLSTFVTPLFNPSAQRNISVNLATVTSSTVNTSKISPSTGAEVELTFIPTSSLSSVTIVPYPSVASATKASKLNRPRTVSSSRVSVVSTLVSVISSISSNTVYSKSSVASRSAPDMQPTRITASTIISSVSSVAASLAPSISFLSLASPPLAANRSETSSVATSVFVSESKAIYPASTSESNAATTLISNSSRMLGSRSFPGILTTALSNLDSSSLEQTANQTWSSSTAVFSASTFANTTEVLSLTKSTIAPVIVATSSLVSAQNLVISSSKTINPSVVNSTKFPLFLTSRTLSTITTESYFPASNETLNSSPTVVSSFLNISKTSSLLGLRLTSTMSVSSHSELTLIPTSPVISVTLVSPNSIGSATNTSQATRSRTLPSVTTLVTSAQVSVITPASSNSLPSEPSLADNKTSTTLLTTRSTVLVNVTAVGSFTASVTTSTSISSQIFPTSATYKTETFSVAASKTVHLTNVSVTSNTTSAKTSERFLSQFSSSFANVSETVSMSTLKTVFKRTLVISTQSSKDLQSNSSTLFRPSFHYTPSTLSIAKSRTRFTKIATSTSATASLNTISPSSTAIHSLFSIGNATTSADFMPTSIPTPSLRTVTLVSPSLVGNTTNTYQLPRSESHPSVTAFVTSSQTSVVPSVTFTSLLSKPSLVDKTTPILSPTRSTISLIVTADGSVTASFTASTSFLSLISSASATNKTENFSSIAGKTLQMTKASVNSNTALAQTLDSLSTQAFLSTFANATVTVTTSTLKTLFTRPVISIQSSFKAPSSFPTLSRSPFGNISTLSMAKSKASFTTETSISPKVTSYKSLSSSASLLSSFSIENTTQFSFLATSRATPNSTMSVVSNRRSRLTSATSSSKLIPKSVTVNQTEYHASSVHTLSPTIPTSGQTSPSSRISPPSNASRTGTLLSLNVTTLNTLSTQMISSEPSVQTTVSYISPTTSSPYGTITIIPSSLASRMVSLSFTSPAPCSTSCKVTTNTLEPVLPSSVNANNSNDTLKPSGTAFTYRTSLQHSFTTLIPPLKNYSTLISPSLGSSSAKPSSVSSSSAVNKERTYSTSLTPDRQSPVSSTRDTMKYSSTVSMTLSMITASLISNSTAFKMSSSFSTVGTTLLASSTGIASRSVTKIASIYMTSVINLTSLYSSSLSPTILVPPFVSSAAEISSVSSLNKSSTSMASKEWLRSTTPIYSSSTKHRVETSALSTFIKEVSIGTSAVSLTLTTSDTDGPISNMFSKLITTFQRTSSTISTLSSIPHSDLSFLRHSTTKIIYPSYFTTIAPVRTIATNVLSSVSLSNPSLSKTFSGNGISKITTPVSYDFITPSHTYSSLTQVKISDISSLNSFSMTLSSLTTPRLSSGERDISSKTTQHFSTLQRSYIGLETTSPASAVSSLFMTSSNFGQQFSCSSCSDMVLGTPALSTSVFLSSSTSTNLILEEYKMQVSLLIPVAVELNESFKRNMERKLGNLYDLGVKKSSLSRKRRAIKKRLFQIPSFSLSDKPPRVQGNVLFSKVNATNVRVKRQNVKETKVKILDISREKEIVVIVFYITSDGEPLLATRAEKFLNLPSLVETVAELGYLVSSCMSKHEYLTVNGEFSAAKSKMDGSGKKKDNETLFIILSVFVPVTFVILSCLFIKCMKKRKSSRKIKFNKVAAQRPGSNRQEQEASDTKSAVEEQYERVPTLPTKDYPDVVIEAPRGKSQSKKKSKSAAQLDKDKGEEVLAPASLFQNITRINYEGSTLATVDEIPLRFRSAIRPVFQEVGTTKLVHQQTPAEQEMVRDSGVPHSWLEKKQKVDLQSRSDEKLTSNDDSVAPRVKLEPVTSQEQEQKVEENTDGDSNDTIQIKANIEKWRNKMRQKEKRKKKREGRKLLEQDKLIALEERKLSRRDWLMAQPEIRAILDSDELSTASSLRKGSHQKRLRVRGHPSDSESEKEVIVMPSRKKKHQRRWRYRSKRVYPAEEAGVHFVSVRPRKQRVYAFEDPCANKPGFTTRYAQPGLNTNSFDPPTQAPMVPQEYEPFWEDEEDSDNDGDDEDYLNSFVPLYENSFQETVPTPRYVTTSGQTVLTHNLPLRMQETSLTTVPITSPPSPSDHPITSRAEKMYFDQRHPRPSTMYPPLGRTKRLPVQNQGFSAEPLMSTGQPAHLPIQQVPFDGTTHPRKVEDSLMTSDTPIQKNLTVQGNDIGTFSVGSGPRTTEAEMRNYNISENEAKILVARVLERAAQKNIHR